ncbi:MAG: hypothetical protein IJI50_04385 [Ruminococcus sp.]|nr:hypothetical protein [Ruminococcus sp.]
MKRIVSLLLTFILLAGCMSAATVTASAAAKPVPGYYVVGTMNGWTLDKSYLMQPSYFNNHYELCQIPLEAGDELKIVYSEDGVTKSVWYPSGTENNYIVEYSNQYYNIELAPDYDGDGEYWYESCILAMPCPPPIEEPLPTEPVSKTRELWERGAELTAEDIEEAANEQLHSRTYFFADKITVKDAYRFNCTPAYIVDFDVEGYGVYLTVILEEVFGDYLFYSTSSYEPSIFIEDKLITLTAAYQKGILTQEMLRELSEIDYRCGNRCRIITRNIKGDADGSGEVDIIDATCIQRFDAEIIGADRLYKPLGDVDGDGEATITDATCIQRYELGLYEIG